MKAKTLKFKKETDGICEYTAYHKGRGLYHIMQRGTRNPKYDVKFVVWGLGFDTNFQKVVARGFKTPQAAIAAAQKHFDKLVKSLCN